MLSRVEPTIILKYTNFVINIKGESSASALLHDRAIVVGKRALLCRRKKDKEDSLLKAGSTLLQFRFRISFSS